MVDVPSPSTWLTDGRDLAFLACGSVVSELAASSSDPVLPVRVKTANWLVIHRQHGTAARAWPSSRYGHLLKPSKMTVKPVYDRRSVRHRQRRLGARTCANDLDCDFHQFDPAPVGRKDIQKWKLEK